MTEDRVVAADDTRTLEQAIVDRVAAHHSEWFPEVAATRVRLRAISRRPRSLLYAVHLTEGCPPQILAKVRPDEGTPVIDAGPTRPRLRTDFASGADLTRLEFAGLTAITQVFGGTDPRFDVVRPLDHLAEQSTILMDYRSSPTLRDELLAHSRLARMRHPLRERPDPGAAWVGAGAWLRRFHDAMPRGELQVRQATREDVCERLHAYADYFCDLHSPGAAPDLARDAADVARTALPVELPLAVGHGDYAPRNIFVDAQAQLTVFDPMPRWAVPRFEDLCRFLVAVRLLGLQVHSHGTAYSASWIEARELEVLAGYYGAETPPMAALRAYELLILLDKWSALVGSGGEGRTGQLRSAAVRFAGGYVAGQARRLLELAEAARSEPVN